MGTCGGAAGAGSRVGGVELKVSNPVHVHVAERRVYLFERRTQRRWAGRGRSMGRRLGRKRVVIEHEDVGLFKVVKQRVQVGER